MPARTIHRTRKTWTVRTLADYCGVSHTTLRKFIRAEAWIARAVWQPKVKGKQHAGIRPDLTEEDVKPIKAHIKRAICRWAPLLRLDGCRRCGTDERPHHARGYCERCYDKAVDNPRRRSRYVRIADRVCRICKGKLHHGG